MKQAGVRVQQTAMQTSPNCNNVHPLLRGIPRSQSTPAHQISVAEPQQPLRRRKHIRSSSKNVSNPNIHGQTHSESAAHRSDESLHLPRRRSRMSEPFLSQVYVTNLEQDSIPKALSNYKKWIASKRSSACSGQNDSASGANVVRSENMQQESRISATARSCARRYRDATWMCTGGSTRTGDSVCRNSHKELGPEIVQNMETLTGSSAKDVIISGHPTSGVIAGSSNTRQDRSLVSAGQSSRVSGWQSMPQPSRPAPSAPSPTPMMALPWQHLRPPCSPAMEDTSPDFDRVERWLSITQTPHAIPKPTTPPSPASALFTSRTPSRHRSTAPSSPIDATYAELEGDMPPFYNKRCDNQDRGIVCNPGMTSCITDWKDLDGCTSDFIHSIRLLEVVTATWPIQSEADGLSSKCDVDGLFELANTVNNGFGHVTIEGHAGRLASDSKSARSNSTNRSSRAQNDGRSTQYVKEKCIKDIGILPGGAGRLLANEHTPISRLNNDITSSVADTILIPSSNLKPHVSRLISPDITPSMRFTSPSCPTYLYKDVPHPPQGTMSTYDLFPRWAGDSDKNELPGPEAPRGHATVARSNDDSATLPASIRISDRYPQGPRTHRYAFGHEKLFSIYDDNYMDDIEDSMDDDSVATPKIPARLHRSLVPFDFSRYTVSDDQMMISMQLYTLPYNRNYARWESERGAKMNYETDIEPIRTTMRMPVLVNKPFMIGNDNLKRLAFEEPANLGATLFTLAKQESEACICAETDDGDNCFVIREVQPGRNENGRWAITFKHPVEDRTVRWDARCVLQEKPCGLMCQRLELKDEHDLEVASITVKAEQDDRSSVSLPSLLHISQYSSNKRFQYDVTVQGGYNFCVPVVMTPVFDFWRLGAGRPYSYVASTEHLCLDSRTDGWDSTGRPRIVKDIFRMSRGRSSVSISSSNVLKSD